MNSTIDAPRTPALIAKAALRYLAERRLQPTPQNYAAAWRAVQGSEGTPVVDAAPPEALELAEALSRVLLDARLLDREAASHAMVAARERRWRDVADRLSEPLLRHRSPGWGELLAELVAAIDRPHRGWTSERKREAIRRAVDVGAGHEEQLAARLKALLEGWQHTPLEVAASEPEAPASAAPAGAVIDAAAAKPAVTSAAPVVAVLEEAEQREARRDRAERLLAEMSELVEALCDSLVTASDDTGWLRDQARTLRDALRGNPDHRQLAQVRLLLAQTQDTQRTLSGRRREALAGLKQMLAQWVGSVATLSDSADRFGERVGGYADEIAKADSLESLADTVHGLISETQGLRTEIERSREEFDSARARAISLESEVSRLEEQLATASAQMITDHLTNTMNRRGLEEAFEGAQQRCREYRGTLSMALLDVDDFKKLNDALGHHGGDGALRHLARLLKEKTRPTDAVARYGGEEFVLLLPDQDLEQAADQMARLQREITSQVFLHEARQTFITFSAGVTRVRAEDSLATAVSRADEAMYAAKRAGKNCVRSI